MSNTEPASKSATRRRTRKVESARAGEAALGKKPVTVSADQRRTMIAESAYLRAEQRGFTGGDPVADWLESEKEVDALLSRASR
jgi:hypothetical protein